LAPFSNNSLTISVFPLAGAMIKAVGPPAYQKSSKAHNNQGNGLKSRGFSLWDFLFELLIEMVKFDHTYSNNKNPKTSFHEN
jgi:hypothetical protein